FAEAELADEGDYSVRVSNAAGDVVSAEARLHVALQPVFAAQPGSVVIGEGETLELGVEMEGAGPFTFAWKHNRREIPGATGPTFSVVDASVADGGYYEVTVTNADGGTATTLVTVSVGVPDAVITAWGDNAGPVPSISGAVAAIEQGGPSYAVRGDGTIVSWDGTVGAPADVPAGLDDVVAVASGFGTHTVVLRADGTVIGWGGASGEATPPA